MFLRSFFLFGALRPRLLLGPIFILAAFAPPQADGQTIGFTELRPFVVGLEPVVGRGGAVGGVLIDADGVLSRTNDEQAARLHEVRIVAAEKEQVSADIAAKSVLRKISLRRLQQGLERHIRDGRPANDDLQNLAGLLRIQYVLVYPDDRDIVLAGPAEGWTIAADGSAVGRSTGQPVLQLDDLIVALRSAKSAATGQGITCSIDPTEEGLQRMQRILKSRGLALNDATAARFEEAVGPQQITITGISPGTHFAQVLVAADFLMKRLAMDLEEPPIDGLPSYFEMLTPRSAAAMPRFWMAPHYDPVLRDGEGLAWQLRGSGVRALTEEGFLSARGTIVSRGKEDPQGKKWADALTERYEELSAKLPAFGQLRSCMDLAVVAALLTKEDLPGLAGCDLSLLLDERRLAVAEFHAPKTVASRASLIKKGRQWIVGISGGVDLGSWEVLDRVETDERVAKVRAEAAVSGERWWWD